MHGEGSLRRRFQRQVRTWWRSMARKTKTVVVGNGITAHEKTMIQEPDRRDFDALFRSIRTHLSDPWASLEAHRPEFENGLARELEKRGEGATLSDFEPHSDPGWYYHQLLKRSRVIRQLIEEGKAGQAAYQA